MNELSALSCLRNNLFTLAALLFCGTIAELLAAKHYQSPTQFVPFGLCGLGLITVARASKRPNPNIIAGARAIMVVIVCGSLWGIYELITGNLSFVDEVRPHASGMTVLRATLQGGDPILAPGVLAVAAFVTILATFARTPELVEFAKPATRGPRQQTMQNKLPT